jgi:hypothetical protein
MACAQPLWLPKVCRHTPRMSSYLHSTFHF